MYPSEKINMLYRISRFESISYSIGYWLDIGLLYFLYINFGQPWWWWAIFILFIFGALGNGIRRRKIGKEMDKLMETHIEA